MCLSIKGSKKYIYFSREWESDLRVEVASNVFLDEHEYLDDQQIASLVAAGWCAPTWSPDDMESYDLMADEEEEGSPCFFKDLNSPVPFVTVANLAVRTLAGILLVPDPSDLEYFAYDEDETPLEFPELGIQFEEPEQRDPEDISLLLKETIQEIVGVPDIETDENGDIGIRSGSALVFIRMTKNNLFISMFSEILTDIKESQTLLSMLNDINATEVMLRVFYKDGMVYAVSDMPSVPFVSSHVALSFGLFCEAADRLGVQLQKDLGGSTAFEENSQSTMLH